MKKTEKKKISLKKNSNIDLKGAQSFIEQGAKVVQQKPKTVKPVKPVYPWEDKTLAEELTKLKPIPTVSLPLEYTLKLEYIRSKIGFTKQSVCRNAIIERIDNILSEHLKK